MADLANAYAEIQARLIDTVLSFDVGQLESRVPACPDWTVTDLMSHLAGGVLDITSGNAPELRGMNLMDQWRDEAVATGRDLMTARQVSERRGRSVESIVDEWRDATASLLPMLRGETAFPADAFPFAGNILVNDLVVHEGDIHEAVGLGPAAEIHATSVALLAYAFSLDNRIRVSDLPALALRHGSKERVVGDGDPAASVLASRTVLVRMLASRLTPNEILALDWDGNPQRHLAVIPEYGPPKYR